jgi:hypothetical protein
METTTTNHEHVDDDTSHDSTSVWTTLIAAASALGLGYVIGRATFSRDVQEAVRRVRESPEPTEVTVRVL